ncbi:MAG: hypothetical protein Q9211_006388 [Gyalolechia sp. 1 TL-2023]
MERPSRLKPARIDPLDRFGLVSKGDTSLLDHKIQESYFELVKTRCRASLGPPSKTGEEDGNALAADLASLSLGPDTSGKSSRPTCDGPRRAPPTAATTSELPIIVMAMRKLREAIVASSRTDGFAKDVYVFVIRATILLGHPESYHPAFTHVFRHLFPVPSWSPDEKKECVGYYILDLACRQHDLAAAFRMRNLYGHRDRKMDLVLTALVHGNWALYRRCKERGNEYERRLMGWADGRMGNHAVQHLGKSYLSAPKAYVERCTGTNWADLEKLKEVSWTLDGDTVVIKQVKRR